MARITLYESELISVWCYPDEGMVHHQIHRYCKGEPFREALQAGSEALVRHRASKWLSDDRLNGALPPDDEQWARTVWVKTALERGWKHWALVQPTSVIGQMNVKRFVEHYRETTGLNMHVFSDLGPAMAWLRSQD